MEYIEFNELRELKKHADNLCAASFYTNSYEFLFACGIVIYGYFKEESSEYESGNLFMYGKTIRPDEIAPSPSNSIFSKLKLYGSSGKYKGLLNSKGETILPNIYDGIYLFAYNRLLVKKNGKYGIIDKRGRILAEPKYEQMVDADEYTIGFILNNKVGYMDINCNVVIEPKYCIDSIDNKFHDGLILVTELKDGSKYLYSIDHYGLIHGNMENISPEEYNTLYGNYSYDNYSDPLDAYDGDPDARWNTD